MGTEAALRMTGIHERSSGVNFRHVAIYVPNASPELKRRMPATVTVLSTEQEVLDWIRGLGLP